MAILKRKVNGSWATVANPQDFPVKVPVEITEAPLQTYEGTVTIDSSGTATVNCGFTPDLVLLHAGESAYYNESVWCALYFDKRLKSYASSYAGNRDLISYPSAYCLVFRAVETPNGFNVTGGYSASNWTERTGFSPSQTFEYIAMKWT